MKERALIVGLGNPGRQYRDNRHNAGFQVVDWLAQRHHLSLNRLQSDAFVTTGTIGKRPVALALPQSYMNRSGMPVARLQKFFKVQFENVLVAYDDLDLPPGTIRLRPSGGAGGHNGMRSIIEQLGSEEFPRLRIGIGRPPGRMDPAAFVLQDFSVKEMEIMREVFERAANAVETWLNDGITLAMSRHNGPATAGEATQE